MIASAVPPAEDLSTEAGLDRVCAEMIAVIECLRTDVSDRLDQLEARLLRAAWLYFLPMWVSVWGVLAVLLLRG